MEHQPASERVTVRRGAIRAEYDPAVALDILRAGIVAHVGVDTPEGPLVLPMAYGVSDDTMYLHGALANALLRAGASAEMCATITLLDGIVVGRSPFHNSMDYRCVVVRGAGRAVTDPVEHERALRLVSDHVVATWDTGRTPTAAEMRRTMVVALPLAEMSVKVRRGGPGDEPEDLDGPHWGGHVPIEARFGAPVPGDDLVPGPEVPRAVAALEGRPVAR